MRCRARWNIRERTFPSADYDIPDMSRFVGLTRSARITATAIATNAPDPNSVGSDTVSYNEPALPAIQFPVPIERNQTPITKPIARRGASLVIALSPTGLRHISPTTLRKYEMFSQCGDTLRREAGGTITRKLNPTNNKAKENLEG